MVSEFVKNMLLIFMLVKRCISLLFLLVLFGASTTSFARVSRRAAIDSLTGALQQQKNDTNKISLLQLLSFKLSAVNPELGIKYGKEALALADELNWDKKNARLYKTIAINYRNLSDYSSALANYYKALQIERKHRNKRREATILNGIGNTYAQQSDYPKALKHYLKALRIHEGAGYDRGVAIALSNISTVYLNLGEYTKALESCQRALRIHEKSGDKNEIANVTGNIAAVYLSEGKLDESLAYFQKSLDLFRETANENGVAATIGNIGEVYFMQRNYTAAIEYSKEALAANTALGDQLGVAGNLIALGECFFAIDTVTNPFGSDRREIEPRLSRYRRASGIPSDKSARLATALGYLQKAVKVANEIGVPDVSMEAYRAQVAVYQEMKDSRHALSSYQHYVAIKDSVFSKNNEKKIVQQQMQYEYGKREDSIKLVNANKEKEAAIRYVRQRNYTYLGVGGVLVLVLFSFFMFRNNKLLGKEKKRSDDLLLNILPAEVASELKDTGSTAARHFDNTTVLFTDFVNFTQASEKMSPQALIDEMHTCFTKFDEITSKYKIEKIKTIGDAYLAAAGLPIPDPDHAAHVIQAAKEITDFMTTRYNRLGDKTFQVRVGIHSGSVVAGIVGVKKFAYDIWGDTVNTAARMEQNSEAGKINISQTTYELVEDTFACEYRGEVAAKGKGMMKMYFVSA